MLTFEAAAVKLCNGQYLRGTVNCCLNFSWVSFSFSSSSFDGRIELFVVTNFTFILSESILPKFRHKTVHCLSLNRCGSVFLSSGQGLWTNGAVWNHLSRTVICQSVVSWINQMLTWCWRPVDVDGFCGVFGDVFCCLRGMGVWS